MQVPFTKMHGLGNDFVVIDQRESDYGLTEAHICSMSDRRRGVGFDQMLLIETSRSPDVDFHCRIFNADGSEVSQCGNGMRCVVRYAIEQGLLAGSSVRISTNERVMTGSWNGGESVQVDMGVPLFEPVDIPFNCPTDATAPYRLPYGDEIVSFSVINVGNPHAVVQMNSLEADRVTQLGAYLSQHRAFPEGVNVGFMCVHSKDHIELQVYERGSGQTQACGSGACAAAVLAQRAGLLGETVRVDQPGGSLIISWSGKACSIQMTGPASVVHNGIYKNVS